MILYRIVTFSNSEKSWTVQWETTKDDARREFLKFHKAGIETVVYRTDFPTDKAGVALAMNMAHANPMNWPWIVEEVFSTRKEARRS